MPLMHLTRRRKDALARPWYIKSPKSLVKNHYNSNFLQVGTILSMLGHQLDDKMLADIINEVDADGSGELEFEEFVQLAARFMVEEDAEVFLCSFIPFSVNSYIIYFFRLCNKNSRKLLDYTTKKVCAVFKLIVCLSATQNFHCLTCYEMEIFIVLGDFEKVVWGRMRD
jgi:hypothetical protein